MPMVGSAAGRSIGCCTCHAGRLRLAPRASAALRAITARDDRDHDLVRSCLFGTIRNPMARLAVFLDRPSHAESPNGVLLDEDRFSASVGTIYAISLGEWLRLASPAPATPSSEIRKFVLKSLDEEARS